ncbi:DUF423 domain-containing protein [uncultured Parvibaculum sp.]|uniref:DUF423 domain-containing protein n=1 Tax=uncultured Parvibaculum sp. TaxID=291828 RepID=UPI0030D91132
MRLWLTIGALSGLVSVALGAFAAHGLQARVGAAELAAFETGARYHMFHALALLAVAWVAAQGGGTFAQAAGWAFFVGTILFSGSLYYLGLTGSRALVLVTPIGGIAFLAGWLALAFSAWTLKNGG